MTMKTPLGQVRGLGSARSGVHHFWAQRVTAVALIPLGLWFLALVVALTGADHATAAAALAHPANAVLMAVFIATSLYHSSLGVQVIIEDYIHKEGTKLMLVLTNQFAHLLAGAAAVFAVLKLAL